MKKATCHFILPTSDFKCCLDSVLICFDQSGIVLERVTEKEVQLVPVNYFIRINSEAETCTKTLLRCPA